MQKLFALFSSPDLKKYLIALVLIIVPLYPKFPFINIPGTYVAIRFEDIILLILGIVVFVNLVPKFKEFWQDRLIRSFLVYFAIGAVSLLSGVFITKTTVFHIGLLHLLRRIEYIIPFLAVLTLFDNKQLVKNLNYYIKVLLIVIGVLFIYGVGQKYLTFPIIITQNQEYSKGVALRFTPGSHINSTFAGHYDMASYMVLVLPILIGLFFILKDKLNKLILFVIITCGLWLLINSLSRIAQISYLMSVGTALILLKKYKQFLLVTILSLALILSSSGLYQRFSRFFTVYAADETVEVFEDRSTNIRLAVEWPRAIRAISKNPILGTGYASLTLATDNDYLRLLGETGVLGFMAFLLIFINLAKELKKGFPFIDKFSGVELAIVVGVCGAILGTLLTATFIDIFEASKFAITFWLLVGFAVSLVRRNRYEYKK